MFVGKIDPSGSLPGIPGIVGTYLAIRTGISMPRFLRAIMRIGAGARWAPLTRSRLRGIRYLSKVE